MLPPAQQAAYGMGNGSRDFVGFYANPATATNSRDSFGAGGTVAGTGSPGRYYGNRIAAAQQSSAGAAAAEDARTETPPVVGKPDRGMGVT